MERHIWQKSKLTHSTEQKILLEPQNYLHVIHVAFISVFRQAFLSLGAYSPMLLISLALYVRRFDGLPIADIIGEILDDISLVIILPIIRMFFLLLVQAVIYYYCIKNLIYSRSSPVSVTMPRQCHIHISFAYVLLQLCTMTLPDTVDGSSGLLFVIVSRNSAILIQRPIIRVTAVSHLYDLHSETMRCVNYSHLQRGIAHFFSYLQYSFLSRYVPLI